MAVQVREAGGVYFVSGELDVSGAEDFRHGVLPALDTDREIVLDLSDLEFIDSMGIRSLVLFASMAEHGVVLRYPKDPVLRVLDLLEIDSLPGIRIQMH